MWPPDLFINDKAFLLNREVYLTATKKYFRWFVSRGAPVARHNEQRHRDTWEETKSARHLVNYLIEQAEDSFPEPLLLQRELLHEGKSLLDTTVGFAINAKLYKARADPERHLREIEVEMGTELAQEDAEHAAELQELKAEVEWRLEETIQDKEGLETSMQEMHEKEGKFWKERIRAMDKQFHRRFELREQELAGMVESLSIQKEASRPSGSEDDTDELERCENALNDARSNLDQARDVYQRILGNSSSQGDGMPKGTVNSVGELTTLESLAANANIQMFAICTESTAATASNMYSVM